MSCPFQMVFYKEGNEIGRRFSNLGWFPDNDKHFEIAFNFLRMGLDYVRSEMPERINEAVPPEGWDEVSVLGKKLTKEECRQRGIDVEF